jgi:acetamidase/formamidase
LARKKKDQKPPKEVDLAGELLLHGKREQVEEGESLLVTTRSLTTKKEKRELPLRILPKEDFLKANLRSGVNALPPLEVVKKAAKEEALEVSLLEKIPVAQRNGKAKSLLLFLKSHLEKSPVDLKRKRAQKKSLTLQLEIKSPTLSEADLEIKNHIQSAVVPAIKSPILIATNQGIKKKVFRRAIASGRKRDIKKISIPISKV